MGDPMTTTVRAAIYGRVSTEDQVDGTSLDEQRRVCGGAIAARGWELAGEYIDEGITGTKRQRPEWQRMLADIRAGNLDAVVVLKLDRFARNAGHAITETDALVELGVTFVSVKENIDLSTAHGRMMRTMLAGFAELERDTIVERTVSGQRAKARDGRWPGGQPPYGWRLEGKQRDARPVPDEAERQVLRLAFEWVTTERLNATQVADRLNSLGLRSRVVGRWSATVVRRTLRDTVLYDGKVVWGSPKTATRRASDHNTRLKRDGTPKYGDPITLTLPEPPLTKTEWGRMVKLLNRTARPGTNVGQRAHELARRIVGGCGKHYTGTYLADQGRDVYRCFGRRYRGADAPRCTCPQVRATEVEQAVWGQVVALLSDPARLRAMAAQWLQVADTDEPGQQIDTEALQQHLARLDRALERAIEQELLADDPEPVRAAARRIRAERGEVADRLQVVLAFREQATGRARHLSDLAALAERAAARLGSMGPAERAQVYELLDVRVTLGQVVGSVPERLTVEGKVDPRLFGDDSGDATTDRPNPSTPNDRDQGADRVLGGGHPRLSPLLQHPPPGAQLAAQS